MAGFLSSTKVPVPPGTKRRFTLDQAGRALPLVSRIVADVVRTHDRAMSVQARIESIGENKAGTVPLHAELDRAMDRLQDFVAELSAVGCELKDYRTGLVDFVGRHKGRDVLLCWKLGEERVAFWHEVTAGYAGRKPVSQLDERG